MTVFSLFWFPAFLFFFGHPERAGHWRSGYTNRSVVHNALRDSRINSGKSIREEKVEAETRIGTNNGLLYRGHIKAKTLLKRA